RDAVVLPRSARGTGQGWLRGRRLEPARGGRQRRCGLRRRGRVDGPVVAGLLVLRRPHRPARARGAYVQGRPRHRLSEVAMLTVLAGCAAAPTGVEEWPRPNLVPQEPVP